tara:strand:- start:541 stop:702 length:162 start_codon:yes stop_codon:yes gene_type:complete
MVNINKKTIIDDSARLTVIGNGGANSLSPMLVKEKHDPVISKTTNKPFQNIAQ